FLFQISSLGVNDLAARFQQAIPLMYVANLFPFGIGLLVLMHRGIRLGVRWPVHAILRAS
ncbi:MAG: hypothetical protein JO007_17130, partial [Alphaproteobacteria bacterium]|nr:hypothetical protein [Alphaproteobacteria bacterium]